MGVVTQSRRCLPMGRMAAPLGSLGVPVTSTGNGSSLCLVSQPGCVCPLFLAVDFKCSFLAGAALPLLLLLFAVCVCQQICL